MAEKTWSERLGLSRKPLRPVGKRLETGKRQEHDAAAKRRAWVKAGILFALVLVTLFSFPLRQTREFVSLEVGEVWRGDDVIAPFDYPLHRTAEELEILRQRIRLDIEPLFEIVPDADTKYISRVDSLDRNLDEVLALEKNWKAFRSAGESSRARRDSVSYIAARMSFSPMLEEEHWDLLAASEEVASAANSASIKDRIITNLRELRTRTLEEHVIDIPRDSILSNDLAIYSRRARTQQTVSILGVQDPPDVFRFVEERFTEYYPQKPDTVSLAVRLFSGVFQPTLVFLQAESASRWQQEESAISPTQGLVKKDQAIIRKGEIVTDVVKTQLQSLAIARTERSGDLSVWRVLSGQLVLISSIFLIFFLYLFLFRRPIFERNLHILLVSLVLSLFVTAFGLSVQLGFPALAVPVAIVSIVLTVVFDSRVGLFGTLTVALIAGLLMGFDYRLTYLSIFAGMVAVFSVRDIKNRSQIMFTSGLVLFAYVLGLTGIGLLGVTGWEAFSYDILMVSINAILLLLAYPLIWVIERLFDVTTDLTLLELSDTNRPLLKELSIRAPGTFNHSLQVANLSEAAADAIGANTLLTRVGALYHDIGKMLKPEYFIENQMRGANPHEQQTPWMSAKIIAAHVKDGVTLAKEYKLPKPVAEFIPMHHGTMRIEYFYHKAVEESGGDKSKVLESDFRYPGPRPYTREGGIMMLADGVEAAAKSLDQPTYRRLANIIDRVFESKINDFQLDQCPLTFFEITKTKEAFLAVLTGMYHVRVKYPGQPDEPSLTRIEEIEEHAQILPADVPETVVTPKQEKRNKKSEDGGSLRDPDTLERSTLD